ncbi:MAG: PKD domain-containing protein [Bacteroidales bacterium]
MSRLLFIFSFLTLSFLSFSQSHTFDFSSNVQNGCSPLKVTFLNQTDISYKNNYSYEWVVEPGKFSTKTDSVENTYVNPGIYTVVMKVYDTDENLVETISKSDYIHVFRDPVVTIQSDKQETCVDENIQFSVDEVDADAPIESWKWVFSDGTKYDGESIPAHMFLSEGDYTVFVSVTDTNGCINRDRDLSEEDVAIFDDAPEVNFSPDVSHACDDELLVNFSNSTLPENVTYEWSFGDGAESSEKSPSHQYSGYGVYYARLIASSEHGCKSDLTRSIRLINYEADFVIDDGVKEIEDNKACIGSVYFSGNASPAVPSTVLYEWDFDQDGEYDASGTTVSHEYLQGGSYEVKLRASNGLCKDSVVRKFEVEEELQVSYEPTDVFYCEPPATVNYSAQSNIPGTDFIWDFYDNALDLQGQNVSVEYHESGFYSESLEAVSPNGCKTTVSKENNIEIASHMLDIQPIGNISGCAPYAVEFDTTFMYSALDEDPVISVQWDLNDDGIDESINEGDPVSYTFTDPGEYPASVVVTTARGCQFSDKTSDILSREIVVVGEPGGLDLEFPDTAVCASSTLSTIFTPDDSTRYDTQYDTLWVQFFPTPEIYQPPETTEIPPKSFNIPLRDTVGPHKVKMYLSDRGCGEYFMDSTSDQYGTRLTEINVLGPIIEMYGSSKNCDDNYNYSYGLRKKIKVDTSQVGQYYEWFLTKISGENTFLKKKIAQNVENININYDHDTLGRGEYKIQVIAHNEDEGCDDSVEVQTHVTDIKPVYTLKNTEVCLNDEARFVKLPESQDVYAAYWIHPDNPTEEVLISDMSYRQKYILNSTDISSVKVVAYDKYGCSADTTIPVKVYQPEAAFFADVVSDCLPFVSQFTDTTVSDTAIVSRQWDFGNGEIMSGNDSIVSTEYLEKGLTSPSLSVVDALGCESFYKAPNYIRPVVPNTEFFVDNPKLCVNNEAFLVRDVDNPDYDNNIDSLMWDFGDGITDDSSLDDTVKHTYSYPSMQGSTFLIQFKAYSTSPENNVCVDSSSAEVDVKDVAAEISIQSMDDCMEPGQKFVVDLNNTWYKSRYDSVAWWKKENGDSIYIGSRPNLNVLFFEEYGRQQLFLETKTAYYGCEVDTTSMFIDVPGYVADIEIDKHKVCLGEEILFSLRDTQNINQYPYYLEFGDGTRVSSGFDNLVHSYDVLPDNVDNTYKAQLIVEASGCKPQDISREISLYPVMADFNRGLLDFDTVGCAPFTVSFENNSVGLDENNYIWDFGDGTTSTEENPTHTFTTVDSIYSVSLSMEASVCAHTATKSVSTYPNADIDYILDAEICEGDSVFIEAVGDFESINWRPSDLFSNSVAAETSAGIPESMYLVSDLVSEHQCESSDSVFVYVQQPAQYLGAPDSLLLYYFSPDSLRFASEISSKLIVGESYNVNNESVEGVFYSWSPADFLSCDDCYSPDIDLQCGKPGYPNCLDFPDQLQYTVYMTDKLGCFEKEQTINFSVVKDSKAALPQAFTPNSDNFNSKAFVRGWGIQEFLELRIYNRWGQMVFMTTNMEKGWDGTFKGEPQKADTYSYTISYINSEGKEEFVKGYITLLR